MFGWGKRGSNRGRQGESHLAKGLTDNTLIRLRAADTLTQLARRMAGQYNSGRAEEGYQELKEHFRLIPYTEADA